MRRRSSKKNEEIMELDKLSSRNLEDPPISGAYIRSLVKQLNTSTTTTNESMNSKGQDCFVARKHGKAHQSTQQQPQQQHKKQVRRRLHTSRPYQERLLNMAEARKEIVTALKFHRAAMKQARERQQQQQQQQQQQPPPPQVQEQHQQSFEQDGRFKGRRNPRIYPSCRANFPNKMEDFSCSYLSQPLPPPSTLAPNSYTWANAPSLITQPPQTLLAENPNFVLPSQTLGLNLNFHDFNNLDATLHLNNSSLSSYSSPTSSSPPLSVVTDQEAHSVGMSQGQGDGSSSLVDTIQSGATTRTSGSGDLHTAMDDEGMAEIRSLGEQYQMEWSDTMNLVKSACWFKYLRNIEHEVPGVKIGDGSYHFFDEVVEFPAWLNANGSCLEKCSDEYFQDSALPCMDIGDIESMDGDWLA
ncbi:uncharacterized protein LOC130955250 isoform X1 [Arachis stenosperma]|uniref:uncharacterized protein LOC130955250 isoform X1 n=1 Tax=Arachis stenosperma TaxID=217475 RepID=UPI0025AD82EC|nr:uncharacterized protein LOC130955250 isoform X1 [Arachis stenosperma]